MILCNKHQNIINIHFNLLYKFHFKNNIILDTVFITLRLFKFLVQVVVCTGIVLKINRLQDFITLKIVKRRKNITKSKNITKQNDKIFFCCFADNLLTERIFLQKFGNAFFITFLSFTLIVLVAVIIIVIRFQKDNTVCLFIAKKSNSIICFLLQISKTNNVAVCLNGIEYSICS